MTNSPGVFLSCKNIFGDNKYIKFALGVSSTQYGFKREGFKRLHEDAATNRICW